MKTIEALRNELTAEYETLSARLDNTALTLPTLDEWTSCVNQRSAVSQQLFRLDLLDPLMTKRPQPTEEIPSTNEDQPDWLTSNSLPEWLQVISEEVWP